MRGCLKKRFVGTNNGAINRQARRMLSSEGFGNNPAVPLPPEALEAHQERTILEIFLNPSLYKGQRVIVTGMILRDEQLKPYFGGRDLAVYRFLINCCAADALPLAIALDPDQADEFVNEQWVQVNGIFDLQQINGKPVPMVSKPRIKLVEAPAFPYLYRPNALLKVETPTVSSLKKYIRISEIRNTYWRSQCSRIRRIRLRHTRYCRGLFLRVLRLPMKDSFR
jgi:hypothetical protein